MACEIDPFNTLLHALGEHLGKGDEKRIRQLLVGNQISKRNMENLNTPVDIFRKLEEGGYISKTNLDFLKSLLKDINRGPLVTEIEKYERTHIREDVTNPAEVNPLKKLFDDLAGQLGSEDEQTIRYLLSNQQISKRDMMRMDDPADIFNKLVESGFISLHNLEFLKKLFENMNRRPLKNIVEEFERKQSK